MGWRDRGRAWGVRQGVRAAPRWSRRRVTPLARARVGRATRQPSGRDVHADRGRRDGNVQSGGVWTCLSQPQLRRGLCFAPPGPCRVKRSVAASGRSWLSGYLVRKDEWGAVEQRMKLTRLSAAPGWCRGYQTRGAASCPRRRVTAGTASQLMRRVRLLGGIRAPERGVGDEGEKRSTARTGFMVVASIRSAGSSSAETPGDRTDVLARTGSATDVDHGRDGSPWPDRSTDHGALTSQQRQWLGQGRLPAATNERGFMRHRIRR